MEFAEDCLMDDKVSPLDPLESNLVRQQSFSSLHFEAEPQQTQAPLNLPCPHESCLIAAVRGLRNGLYYGGKVRFAHSLVM